LKKQYKNWSPRRAARFGYLAGRGLSADAIGSDSEVGAISLRSVRLAATRWGLPLGTDGALLLPDEIRHGLDEAARARRLSVEALALRVLRIVVADNLAGAILDDGAGS
jgi:hypothetical protein